MGRILHADGVQVRITDLLADLQVVVPIVQEALGVLGQAQSPQPLADNVANGHGVS